MSGKRQVLPVRRPVDTLASPSDPLLGARCLQYTGGDTFCVWGNLPGEVRGTNPRDLWERHLRLVRGSGSRNGKEEDLVVLVAMLGATDVSSACVLRWRGVQWEASPPWAKAGGERELSAEGQAGQLPGCVACTAQWCQHRDHSHQGPGLVQYSPLADSVV